MIKYVAQVVIIGGGATGVGILRDLSMRGISAMLFEQGDLAQGTSSRFHGLLHSGARYAAKDPISAAECAAENAILKQVAPMCIRDIGGWFIQGADDDPEYVKTWLEGCRQAGITVKEIPLAQAWAQEPLLGDKVVKVFEVPDAAVDGFKLVWANAKAAVRYGGSYKTYHRVEQVCQENDRVTGVTGLNLITNEKFTARSQIVVNAAGAWAGQIAATAGVSLDVICDKGTLLAFNQRLFKKIINRLRSPGDGDIFVPHETITIFGTTAKLVESPQENQPTVDEVKNLLDLGAELVPDLAEYRVIRAFAGVRPLYGSGKEHNGEGEEGREVSRNFALVYHEAKEGIKGFVSIVGGKFTTYRLMAEKVSDWVVAKLGISTTSRTAKESLCPPVSQALYDKALALLPCGVATKMMERLGDEAGPVLEQIEQDPSKGRLLCECEMVSLAEIQKTVMDEDAHNLADVRRKTRLGMGTCQGAFCTYRALPLMQAEKVKYDLLQQELEGFLNQRWKGIRPVLWGDQLRETELTRGIYAGLLNLGGN